ncbi:Mu transposase C-terminal domain-containing protein [Streptomyces sp. NPDC059544]|uniref:Mu transposase C-terminal domain-containing protein n=1 Tax=Streptomyces sp. NPDC059544 TaxID=3346861 RepID=UPI0036B3CE21
MPPQKPKPDLTPLRQAALSHLLHLEATQQLTGDHKRIVAQSFGCSTKTIDRWMDNARAHDGHYTPKPRDSLRLTPAIHDALARWCGNIAAAYRELTAEGHLDIPGQPGRCYSYATLHRTVTRELDPGHRAGLKGGETARRRHDIHNTRERGHRNQAWEGDHKTADTWVNLNGKPAQPSITWFADCATDGICGLAITPHTPSREAILVALRAAILRGPHHGPFGGAPGLIRIDRGKDFLCQTVEEALGAFSIKRVDLPPRHPELKGTIESINDAVKDMLFAGLPGYTKRPSSKPGKTKRPPLEDLLTFEAFVTRLLQWVHQWNHEHKIRNLGNRTPAQAWEDDLTLIRDIPPEALHTFTLETDRTTFTIQGDGVHWKNLIYLDTWMNGHAGEKVTVRYMPHHDDRIELCDPKTGKYRGPGFLQRKDPDAEERRRELRRVRERSAAALKRRLNKTEASLRERYSAVSDATSPRRLNPPAETDPDARLRQLRAEPDNTSRPLPEPTASWDTPTPTAEDDREHP